MTHLSNTSWQRPFFTIWAGQFISIITSACLQMALIWYLTIETQSAAILSLATLVGFLPQALLGPFIGVLVDRHNRKHIMIAADLFIATVAAAMIPLSASGDLAVWLVLAALFLRSVGTAFHSPALSAITPLLVPEDHLAKCAGYSQSIQSASLILGPAIAATLYSTVPIWVILLVDIVGAVVACTTVALVDIPPLPKNASPTQGGFTTELAGGLHALRKQPGLFALLLMGCLFMVAFFPINALYPLICLDYFGGTPISASVAEITFSIGMLVGGALMGAFGFFANRAAILVGADLLMGLSLVLSGLLPPSGFVAFTVLSGLMGLSGALYNGVQMALYQERIAPEYLGRVFALVGSISSLAMPIGLILSAAFTDLIGVNRWFTLSGGLVVAIGILMALIPSIRALGHTTPP